MSSNSTKRLHIVNFIKYKTLVDTFILLPLLILLFFALNIVVSSKRIFVTFRLLHERCGNLGKQILFVQNLGIFFLRFCVLCRCFMSLFYEQLVRFLFRIATYGCNCVSMIYIHIYGIILLLIQHILMFVYKALTRQNWPERTEYPDYPVQFHNLKSGSNC